MKHTVKERVLLLGLLPAEGSILTLKIVRKLRENLSFSEEELGKYQFEEKGGRLTWKDINDPPKDIVIGKEGKKIIKKALQELDKQEKLMEDHIPLYEKYADKEDD